MDYNQFWAWMEFNRLTGFIPGEDLRNSQLLSMIHNVNVTKENQLKSKDFMPKTIDQLIEDEIAEEKRQMEQQEDPSSSQEAAVHHFKDYVKRLKASGRPVNTITVKE